MEEILSYISEFAQAVGASPVFDPLTNASLHILQGCMKGSHTMCRACSEDHVYVVMRNHTQWRKIFELVKSDEFNTSVRLIKYISLPGSCHRQARGISISEHLDIRVQARATIHTLLPPSMHGRATTCDTCEVRANACISCGQIRCDHVQDAVLLV